MHPLDLKRCVKCGHEKQLTNFVWDMRYEDGLGWCLDCDSQGRNHVNPSRPPSPRGSIKTSKTERRRELCRVRRVERRERCFNHYGRCCKCCGENRLYFLALDHINGGGKKHLNDVKGKYRDIEDWIIRSNFPPIFQALCHNCNMAKGTKEECPCQKDIDHLLHP